MFCCSFFYLYFMFTFEAPTKMSLRGHQQSGVSAGGANSGTMKQELGGQSLFRAVLCKHHCRARGLHKHNVRRTAAVAPKLAHTQLPAPGTMVAAAPRLRHAQYCIVHCAQRQSAAAGPCAHRHWIRRKTPQRELCRPRERQPAPAACGFVKPLPVCAAARRREGDD